MKEDELWEVKLDIQQAEADLKRAQARGNKELELIYYATRFNLLLKKQQERNKHRYGKTD
jgi:hypothetical protein